MAGFKNLHLAVAAVVAAVAVAAGNMNSRPYLIANPPANTPAVRGYRGEHFEFYGPNQTSRYGDVNWHPETTDLPADIVARFDGKTMAITGYESTIVRISAAGVETEVPAWEQYNHHYSGFMHGKAATMHGQSSLQGPHGGPLPHWRIAGADAPAPAGIPHVQAFSEGNGNEHRVSYKGYAKGVAQLIHSPVTFTNNAMIINTNKRLTGDTSPGPIGGPVPALSLAPPGADYQGILECPCTTRKIKILDGYTLRPRGVCPAVVTTHRECISAGTAAGIPATSATYVRDAAMPPGCSASVDASGAWALTFNNDTGAKGQCGPEHGAGAPVVLAGAASASSVSLAMSVDAAAGKAVLTLSCASNGSWFGVGLNASAMADLPYAIVVDGAGAVSEHKLGMHQPGTPLPATATVLSSTLRGGTRTLKLSLPLKSATGFDFSNLAEGSLQFIAAVGKTPTFAYHKARSSGTMALGVVGSLACLCRDPTSNTGTIDGNRFNPSVCAPFPTSNLITTHNAICNISRYGGGLYCCHDKSVLLDADQKQPEPTDTWRMKYRFYYEDHTNQANTFRVWWSTEAYNNEYDIPKSTADCLNPATDPEDCVHTIRSEFKGVDMLSGGSGCMVSGDSAACGNVTRIRNEYGGFFRLTYAAFHCHAPACMTGELWNRDTGELVCRNTALYGNGTEPLDEKGYVVGIPPCVWGSAEEGLAPPPILHLDTNLTTIKRGNSTNGHWGVMSLWQMRAAYLEHKPN